MPRLCAAALLLFLLATTCFAVSPSGKASSRGRKAVAAGKKSPRKKPKGRKAARPSHPRKAPSRNSRAKATPPRKPRPAPSPSHVRAVPSPVGIENPEALSPFFERLRELEPPRAASRPSTVVRILHFGDSHVAADYWTGEIRNRLQERFGDAGPGHVVPGYPWRFFRHAAARSLDGSGWKTVGLGETSIDGLLGPGGVALAPLATDAPASVLASFTRFEVQAAGSRGVDCLRVTVDDLPADHLVLRTTEIVPSQPSPTGNAGADVPPGPAGAGGDAGPAGSPGLPAPAELVYLESRSPLPEGLHKLSVHVACTDDVRVLGVDLRNGRGGILYDTLGINGARMSAMDKWAPGIREAVLRHTDPALVILSYGTNDIAARGFEYNSFRADCVRILSRLKEELPGVPVLVTGPIDRSSWSAASRPAVASGEILVIRALREAARETGCAFWDARQAMGGEGAIREWVRRGLARGDYVHLTGRGYRVLGGMLFDRLMDGFERYGSPIPSGRTEKAGSSFP